MISMDPQQEIFTQLRTALARAVEGVSVYDGKLPPAGTKYPFIYLGELSQEDVWYKASIGGTIRLSVHVWHNDPGQRGTVSQLMRQVKQTAIGLHGTDHYFDYSGASETVQPDTSTGKPLLHGVVDLKYQYF